MDNLTYTRYDTARVSLIPIFAVVVGVIGLQMYFLGHSELLFLISLCAICGGGYLAKAQYRKNDPTSSLTMKYSAIGVLIFYTLWFHYWIGWGLAFTIASVLVISKLSIEIYLVQKIRKVIFVPLYRI